MKKTVNKKKNQKMLNWEKQKISFVWRDKAREKSKWRIVCYEWRVLEDLWDTVKCEMIDRYIHNDNIAFIKTFLKKEVKIN